MYRIKHLIQRAIEEMNDGTVSHSSLEETLKEALGEVTAALETAQEEPQEMRDLFAAAALLKVNADTKERLVERCWDISDAMMLERALRIKAREVAGETQKHDN